MMGMGVNKLIEEIRKLDLDDLYKIEKAIDNDKKDNEESELMANVKANKSYVGKCYKKKVKPHSGMFPEMWRYLKVISERSTNQYRMEVLTFDEHPVYWFEYQSSKIGHTGDFFLGEFEYNGIHTTDYPFFCYDILNKNNHGKYIDTLTEITLDEYNQALDNYIEELKELTWYPDHHRFGGKLPTDPDWPEEERK